MNVSIMLLLPYFAAGFDKVITVGSDCPFLRSHHLLQAASELDEGLVLGPDHRGGVYPDGY